MRGTRRPGPTLSGNNVDCASSFAFFDRRTGFPKGVSFLIMPLAMPYAGAMVAKLAWTRRTLE